jgi:steroid delta-isomerase-like uncharacterized protein
MSDPGTADVLIRRYLAAFNAGDIDGMIDCLADDVVHDVNQGERRVGREAFRAFCRHMQACYAETLTDIVVMVAPDGGRAAAEFVVHGRYLATDQDLPEARGQSYVLPAGSFFAIRDGRIARVTTCYNLKQWQAQIAGG